MASEKVLAKGVLKMKIVSNKEYYEVLRTFINKHEITDIITSPLVNGEYSKKYLCEDGANGWEINRIIYEEFEVEKYGVKSKVQVAFLQTEWFDTDNGTSIYMYDRY